MSQKITRIKFAIVSYCYPTSPNAMKFGYGKTGCFTAGTVIGNGNKTYDEKAFATKAEAHAHALTFNLPFHKYSA